MSRLVGPVAAASASSSSRRPPRQRLGHEEGRVQRKTYERVKRYSGANGEGRDVGRSLFGEAVKSESVYVLFRRFGDKSRFRLVFR